MSRRMGAPSPAGGTGEFSQVHLDSYSLPQASRVPKVMIAGVAGFIVLVTALYYLCKWLCNRNRSSSDSSNGSNAAAAASSNAAAPQAAAQAASTDEKSFPVSSKVEVKSIPEIGYAELEHLRRSDSEDTCAVCLTEFCRGDKNMMKMLPGCRHAFHSSCIDLWLSSHASCPVCRARL